MKRVLTAAQGILMVLAALFVVSLIYTIITTSLF